MPDLPTISIVTPSYNQGRFLEDCLLSVLDQGYPNLEYVVMDGGSTDESVEVIHKYEERLSAWVSEPDRGQYDAINEGFAKTSGEVMGWLNSDDRFMPGALSVVGEVFAQLPEVEWITTAYPVALDEAGRAIECRSVPAYHRDAFLRGRNLAAPGLVHTGFIQQESTFWRRSLWERTGGHLDTSISLAADFELWARFFRHTDLYAVQALLGAFRRHGAQKTASGGAGRYTEEAIATLGRFGGRPYGRLASRLRPALARWVPPERHSSLRRFGLAYPGFSIAQDGSGSWVIETKYFV